MSRPLAPAGTGVSSWMSWNRQTVAVTTSVRPTTAAALTLTNSASGQVLDHLQPRSSDLPFPST